MKPKVLLYVLGFLYLFLTGCSAPKRVSTTKGSGPKNEEMPATDALLASLLANYPQYFDSILKQKDKWRIQVIYSQVDRKADNTPVITHHYFNVDPKQYFYPASTVKLPGALLALQKLNDLNVAGVDKNTTMITEKDYPGQTAVYNDPSSPDGRPTIGHYIKKIFLVSDNDAFNRLYEFLGQEYINKTLHEMGYDSVQILHRLQLSYTEDQHQHTNPVRFVDSTGKTLYSQPLVTSRLKYQQRKTLLGKGYMSGGKVVDQPFDFSRKNRITLENLHSILQSVIFPETVAARQRFRLTGDDYSFLYKYMSMKPSESLYPQYDSTYNEAYSKFLLFGGKGKIPEHIRVFNKEGDAYGFLNDVAYIADFKNGVEFMLSATILCNSDGIFNDDNYDYETVGFPFLKHLGEVIYEYELKRKRNVKPDLSKFIFDYSK